MLYVLLIAVVLTGVLVWARRNGVLHDWTETLREQLAKVYPARPLSARALPRKLLRAAERTRSIGVSGATLVPSQIEIRVHPDDLAAFGEALDWLSRDIATALRKQAQEHQWTLPAGPEIEIVEDPERPLRLPRASGRFSALSAAAVERLTGPNPVVPDRAAETKVAPDPTRATAPPPPAGQETARVVHLRLVAAGQSPQTGEGDLNLMLVSGQAPLLLGRSRQADLQVQDTQVSGQHCRFFIDPGSGEPVVEDVGSTNGTHVAGAKVTRQALRSGDTLQVGNLAWRIELDAL